MSTPADPGTAPRDTTTAMIVAGLVGASEGTGVGFALRIERQTTNRTALGAEITAGHGTEPRHPDAKETPAPGHDLFAVRGYGRYELVDDYIAATYGAGLSWFGTGMITLALHGGLILGVSNDYVIPVLPLGLAIAVPLRTGQRFGLFDKPEETDTTLHYDTPRYPRFPRAEIYPYGGLGLIGNMGSTGNYLSIDVALAIAMREGDAIGTISISDYQRFEPAK